MIPANALIPLLALATGWLALFPARRELGVAFYHLAAFPTGLLAWLAVAGLTTALGTPFSAPVALVGHVLFVALVASTTVLLGTPKAAGPTVPWWSWPVWGGVFGAMVIGLTRAGGTAVAFDSYTHYEISGIALFDTGLLDSTIMSARGPLIPAMHAATRLAGGEWTYVPYTLFGITTLTLLALALHRTAFRHLPTVVRTGLSVAMVALLGSQAAWISHSYFVHSNMMSALYLLLAVVALLAGSGHLSAPSAPQDQGTGWWAVAGLAAVGLATARPDGYAYIFVVLALAFALHARDPGGWRKLAALYLCLAGLTALVYLPVFGTIGIWSAYKLQGSWTLALLAGVVGAGVLTLLVPRIPVLGEWLRCRGTAVRLLAAVNVATILPLAWVFREQFRISTGNILGNLMQTGGWGFLWYAAFGFVLLSLLFRRSAGFAEREDLILYTLVQFFAVGLTIHGLTHPGRLNWMDSFNRVSLHALPIAWWYMGLFLGALLASRQYGATSSPSSHAPDTICTHSR